MRVPDEPWHSGYLRLYWTGYQDRIWLARARSDRDPLGSAWLALALWTPSTWSHYWDEWMYVHVDPFAQQIACYVDMRDDGGPEALTVEAAVPIADLNPDDDTQIALEGDDPAGLLALAGRVFRPQLQVDPASEEFLDQMRTEDDWDGSNPWVD